MNKTVKYWWNEFSEASIIIDSNKKLSWAQKLYLYLKTSRDFVDGYLLPAPLTLEAQRFVRFALILGTRVEFGKPAMMALVGAMAVWTLITWQAFCKNLDTKEKSNA